MFRKCLLLVALLILPTAVFAQEKSKAMDRVQRDVTRLEVLLLGLKSGVVLDVIEWRQIGNEANMLANRIHANVRTAKGGDEALGLARDLRTHMRELHKEAHEGDAASARRHASEALPIAFRLDEWAS